MEEEKNKQEEVPATEEVKEEPKLQSQKPAEPKGEKVFISEAELQALEAKVKGAPKDEQEAYSKAAQDLREAVEAARREEFSKQEQDRKTELLQSELDAIKQELEAVKEQANRPVRKGVAHTPQNIFQKDDSGKVGIPVSKMNDMLRDYFDSKIN